MDKEQLRNLCSAIAGSQGFRPRVIEKDYYLTSILGQITEGLHDCLVFKGGTLLNKVYLGYHRLSEDLDFIMNLPEEELAERSSRRKITRILRDRMPVFLNDMRLYSKLPEGEVFDEHRQYRATINYESVFAGKEYESIKLEISLRHTPCVQVEAHTISHVFHDPFTGESIFPTFSINTLSLKEALAEKLRAALSRRDPAIRDYYDLWYAKETGFDFIDREFNLIFAHKLREIGYAGNMVEDIFENSEVALALIKQVERNLYPVVRGNTVFDAAAFLSDFLPIAKIIQHSIILLD